MTEKETAASLARMDSKSMVDPALDPLQHAILCNQSMGVTILPRRGTDGAWGYDGILNEKGREAWSRAQGLFRGSTPKQVFTHPTGSFSLHHGSDGASVNLSLYCYIDDARSDITHHTKTSALVFLEINDGACYALSYTGSVYQFDRRLFDEMDKSIYIARLEKGGGGQLDLPLESLPYRVVGSVKVVDFAAIC